MRVLLFFLVFAAMFCLFSSAIAAIEGFPSEIEFFNAPRQINFSVSNPADSAKRVSIEFLSPMDANIVAPVNIGAGKDANVSITLHPTAELVGQSYESMLVVKIGPEETRKRVRLFFNPAKSDSNNFGGLDSNAFNISGIVSFFSTPNTELALDTVLIIVVVILLIAFISRLVKRFHGE